jgi:hypothetical protein
MIVAAMSNPLPADMTDGNVMRFIKLNKTVNLTQIVQP